MCPSSTHCYLPSRENNTAEWRPCAHPVHIVPIQYTLCPSSTHCAHPVHTVPIQYTLLPPFQRKQHCRMDIMCPSSTHCAHPVHTVPIQHTLCPSSTHCAHPVHTVPIQYTLLPPFQNTAEWIPCAHPVHTTTSLLEHCRMDIMCPSSTHYYLPSRTLQNGYHVPIQYTLRPPFQNTAEWISCAHPVHTTTSLPEHCRMDIMCPSSTHYYLPSRTLQNGYHVPIQYTLLPPFQNTAEWISCAHSSTHYYLPSRTLQNGYHVPIQYTLLPPFQNTAEWISCAHPTHTATSLPEHCRMDIMCPFQHTLLPPFQNTAEWISCAHPAHTTTSLPEHCRMDIMCPSSTHYYRPSRTLQNGYHVPIQYTLLPPFQNTAECISCAHPVHTTTSLPEHCRMDTMCPSSTHYYLPSRTLQNGYHVPIPVRTTTSLPEHCRMDTMCPSSTHYYLPSRTLQNGYHVPIPVRTTTSLPEHCRMDIMCPSSTHCYLPSRTLQNGYHVPLQHTLLPPFQNTAEWISCANSSTHCYLPSRTLQNGYHVPIQHTLLPPFQNTAEWISCAHPVHTTTSLPEHCRMDIMCPFSTHCYLPSRTLQNGYHVPIQYTLLPPFQNTAEWIPCAHPVHTTTSLPEHCRMDTMCPSSTHYYLPSRTPQNGYHVPIQYTLLPPFQNTAE
ncbi:hypothetical protein ACOMHN_061734 [Nucella lapillus]